VKKDNRWLQIAESAPLFSESISVQSAIFTMMKIDISTIARDVDSAVLDLLKTFSTVTDVTCVSQLNYKESTSASKKLQDARVLCAWRIFTLPERHLIFLLAGISFINLALRN